MTSLRYEFRLGSLDIRQVTKDALYVLYILPRLTPGARVAKPSLELVQEASSEFSLQ